MDNPFKSPAILSLCPGMLGLERGLERAIGRVNVIAYVEIEAFIIANLVAAMEQGVLAPAPIWSDVKTFNPEPFRSKLHGIIGGYPCQPFSNAGNRLGTDDQRHLAPYIFRIIETTKPVWCFFENVEGHLTLGYDTVYQSIRDLGYAVEAGIFSAEEAGAPHQRNRLFILAIREDVDYTSSYGLKSKHKVSTGRNCAQYASKGNELAKRDRWPARPGEPQNEWEDPRTIESGMGCTVNGYNFREDLLRAYGNAVVEQTAEIAFKTLMKKHINTIK